MREPTRVPQPPSFQPWLKGLSNFKLDGVDHSANAPALPGSLLATIPANRSRRGYFIQNQDGTNSVVVQFLDSAGANGSQLILAPGASAGSQGGSITLSGMPHTGIIKIFSSAGTTKMGAREW